MSDPLPFARPELRVISEQAAADLCDLSVATMRRMRQAGTGPAVVRLSPRRIGYRLGTLEGWLMAREGEGRLAA